LANINSFCFDWEFKSAFQSCFSNQNIAAIWIGGLSNLNLMPNSGNWIIELGNNRFVQQNGLFLMMIGSFE